MSEKRFTLTDWHEVKDNGKIMTVDEVVGKLNEQQATIKQQDIEIKNLNLHIRKLVDESEISQQLMKEYERNDKLEAKIESMVEQHKARLDKLIEKIGEQQSTIDKRERQLRRALSYLISDTCSLSEAKIREIEKELEMIT